VKNSEFCLDGKRCLVLDDEFLIALDIQKILEAAGAFSVTCANNIVEALVAIKHGPRFDIAMLDVVLGRAISNGIIVATILAEHGTPFVFVTGIDRNEMRASQYPHIPVVGKPYTPQLLLEALASALGSSR
jgi:CheY-like chemotaxis protein